MHFLMVLIGELVKDHSNFYLVIMSLILITFSLDLCNDVRRNLMLVTLRLGALKGQWSAVEIQHWPGVCNLLDHV